LHIHCAEASFLLRDRRLWIARNNELLPVVIEADSNPVSDFLDQLLDGVPNEAPADCALPVFDFTQAILESGRSGQAVRTGSGL
jgi:hypothetical protein